MSITLQLQHTVQTRGQPTPASMQVAMMFGLSLDGSHQHTVIPPTRLTLAPGQIVFITGTSGGGKTTLLRLIESAVQEQRDGQANEMDQSAEHGPGLVWVDQLPALPDLSLVDALAKPEATDGAARQDGTNAKDAEFEEICRWLSQAGLNDAAVMLRRPSELSVGQRHRLRLAQAIAVAERRPETWSLLLADEFGSSLDRTTAVALAGSLRRWVTRSNLCLVAATAHDDLLEPIAPDVLVEVGPGGQCAVHRRPV